MAKRNSERAGGNKYGALSNFNSPMNDQFSLPGMKSRGDPRARGEIGSGFQSRTLNEGTADYSRGAKKRGTYGGKGESTKQHSQEREQYYKFYLDSAQKAIEMMRKQHKSASIMKMSSEPASTGNIIQI